MKNHQRGSARRWGAAMAVVLGLVVSACGGSSDSSSSGDSPTTTSGASAPTGEPIKLMTVTTLNANGPTYENISITAELAAQYLNNNGGIQGRPVEVIVCDEQFDAAVAAACARKAVEEGVVSVIGSFTFFAEAIVPVIAASDITWFGACCAISPSELGSPHSFPMGNQPMYAVGAVKRAVEDGCVNINAVVAEGADAIFLPPMINAMKAYGREFNDVITPSPVSQDYSADLARSITGVDCMVVVKSETPFLTWNTAYEQAQTTVKQYGNQGNLNAVSAKGAERATDGNIIVGMYPDLSTSPWDDYRATLEANNIDQVANDFNSLGGMGTWAAYMGFAQIAATIQGEITAASFFEAASMTTALDLDGMVPVLDFTKEWTDGLPGYNRLFNRSIVFSQLSNGQVVSLDNNFTDVSDLALGRAPK